MVLLKCVVVLIVLLSFLIWLRRYPSFAILINYFAELALGFFVGAGLFILGFVVYKWIGV